MSQWYVLQHRNELKTRDLLAEYGFFGYVPMETIDRFRGHKKTVVERPVWRGYVFVLCQPDAVDSLTEITAGHFVRVERVPITLPLHQLDLIIAAETAGELDSTSKDYVPQRGDHARIKSGKWQSYLGIILSVGKRKVILQMEKGAARMEIPTEHLEAAA